MEQNCTVGLLATTASSSGVDGSLREGIRKTIAYLQQLKALGRPSKFEAHRAALKAMLDGGVAKAEMARRRGLSYNTVKGYLRQIEAQRAASA